MWWDNVILYPFVDTFLVHFHTGHTSKSCFCWLQQLCCSSLESFKCSYTLPTDESRSTAHDCIFINHYTISLRTMTINSLQTGITPLAASPQRKYWYMPLGRLVPHPRQKSTVAATDILIRHVHRNSKQHLHVQLTQNINRANISESTFITHTM